MSAGGVVARRADPANTPEGSGAVSRTARSGWEVLLGEQLDRNTGRVSIRLPKGHLDEGESAQDAAIREVLEETGQRAEIGEPLGEIRYEYFEQRLAVRIAKRVRFFLMFDLGPGGQRDGELSSVFWCPIEDAAQRLSFEAEVGVVARAAVLLARR